MRRRLILHINRISSLKVFHVLLYRRLSILQDMYFLCRIRRFVSELIEDACMHTIQESQGPRNFRHCQKAKTWWPWRVISIIAENKPGMLITRLICIQLCPTRRDSYPQFPRSLLATPGSMTSLWRGHTKKKKKKEQRNACIFRVSLIKQGGETNNYTLSWGSRIGLF